MKKILFKKLLFDFLNFFLVALLSSSIILWVFQAVNFLDIMIEDGRDYGVYIKYSLLNFPKILSKLYTFMLFFSLFYIILKYENSNELIIFWNFGINKIQLVNFIFLISIFLMIVQLILTSLVVPKTQDVARSFLRTSTVNFLGNFIKPQKFNDTMKGITIYSEKKNKNGDLFNLYVKREIKKNHIQVTYAKKGVFKEIDNLTLLILFDGETITQKNNEITNISFTKSDFPLNNFQSNTTTYKKTQEISTLNLYRCIEIIYEIKFKKNTIKNSNIENCSINNQENIYKEIYKRLFIPFYIPALTLITFILIFSSKENLNYTKRKIFTFLTGLTLIILSETTIRMISVNIINNFILAFLPIIILIILYFLFLKKFIFVSYKK